MAFPFPTFWTILVSCKFCALGRLGENRPLKERDPLTEVRSYRCKNTHFKICYDFTDMMKILLKISNGMPPREM